ncbi:hypothetical protein MTO96_024924 [Rhipicephalus appendiculatus]
MILTLEIVRGSPVGLSVDCSWWSYWYAQCKVAALLFLCGSMQVPDLVFKCCRGHSCAIRRSSSYLVQLLNLRNLLKSSFAPGERTSAHPPNISLMALKSLFADDPSQLEANRCSCWYIAFSGFVLSALWTTAVINIVRFLVGRFHHVRDPGHRLLHVHRPAHERGRAGVLQCADHTTGPWRKVPASNLRSRVAVYRLTKLAEKRPGRRLPELYERRLQHTYVAVVVFVVGQIAMKVYFLVMTISGLDEPSGVARFTAILAIVSVATVWSGAPAICATLVGRWLSAHIRLIRANLETVAAQSQRRGSNRVTGHAQTPLFTSDMLVATRRDLSELRRILRAWNGSLQPGLLAQFSSDSLGMCTALYILLAGQAHSMRVVAQALVRSALAGVVLFVATWSSDDIAKQFQTFLLSLNSKEFLFTASGFFDLKLSLLSKLAGAVFIHTTILIQMMRLGRGCVGTGFSSTKQGDDEIEAEGRDLHCVVFLLEDMFLQ